MLEKLPVKTNGKYDRNVTSNDLSDKERLLTTQSDLFLGRGQRRKMKNIKILGLVVVAALALTAVVGASGASASVLCKVQTTNGICPVSSVYPAGTEITAEGSGQFVFENAGTVYQTCSSSNWTMKTNNAGPIGESAETVKATNTLFTFKGCTNETAVSSLGETTFLGGSNGKDGAVSLERGWRMTQHILGVTCVFSAANFGTVLGGAPAYISVNATLRTVSGPCSNRTVKGAYTITKLSPLYINWYSE
jgi:hypothetical protein